MWIILHMNNSKMPTQAHIGAASCALSAKQLHTVYVCSSGVYRVCAETSTHVLAGSVQHHGRLIV